MENNQKLEVFKKRYAEISDTKRKIRQSSIGKIMVSEGQNKREFEKIRLKVLQELCPRTKIQEILVEKFISATWNHERANESLKQLLTQQNLDKYRKDLERYSLISAYDLESWRGRMRKVKAINLADPNIESILKYIISQEKNIIKLLEQIRIEQALNNPHSNA